MGKSSPSYRAAAFLAAGGAVLLLGASLPAFGPVLDPLAPAPLAAACVAAPGTVLAILLVALRPPRIGRADWARAALGGAVGGLLLSPWLVRGLVQVGTYPAAAWGAAAFLAFGSSVIGYLLWMRVLDRFGAGAAPVQQEGPAGVAGVQPQWPPGPSGAPASSGRIRVGRREILIGSAAVGLQSVMPGCRATTPRRAGTPDDTARAVLDGIVERMLRESPETATSVGIDVGARAGLRAKLGDRSRASVDDQQSRNAAALEQLRRLDRDSLSPELAAACDVALYAHELVAAGAAFGFGDHTIHAAVSQTASPYVVSQMTGSFFHVPEFLNTEHPIETARDAEAYLARLSAFAGALDAETERIASDSASGIVPPGFILDLVLGQMDRYLAAPPRDSVLVQSLARRCQKAGVPGDMEARALRLVETAVLPALARQRQELFNSRAGAAESAGVGRLPGGEAYYAWHLRVATTTSLSADEIHAMGLERSRAIESRMDQLLRAEGLRDGSVGERMIALGKDPRFLFAGDDAGRAAALAHVEGLIARTRARMAEFSQLRLRADVQVRRVPAEIEEGAAGGYVAPGSLDGARPAYYWLNLRDPAVWPTWALPTLTYHEALPGHVWQEAYGLERRPWHLVRALLRFNAYSEGWALYAEQLADELGWYDGDPFGRLGYLQAQQRRASRLVVDTGLHARGWSRDRAIEWMVRTSGSDRGAMTNEVNRYCVKPGQACGYMVGCLEILRLRARATRAGRGDELRAFNDAIVAAGNTPLSLLERSIERAAAARRGRRQ